MPLKTKRWNDPVEKSDGLRLLVCRYRPRALPKADETWNAWCPDLAPSKKLHADYYGKNGPPISFDEFTPRYLQEMETQQEYLDEIAAMVAEGKTVTLLCSSACVDEAQCHRILLRRLIEARLKPA
jgi:uncharacterized protein YeaO (DUF488 family)